MLFATGACEAPQHIRGRPGPAGWSCDDPTPIEDRDASCPLQWGLVAEPAAPGTEHLTKEINLRNLLRPSSDSTRLTVKVEHAEARTQDGRTIQCRIRDHDTYDCCDEAGLRDLTVSTAAGSVTSDVGGWCYYPHEDTVDLLLRDVPPCVQAETEVVSGKLLAGQHTQLAAARVWLIGPKQPFWGPENVGEYPFRSCSVAQDEYRCTTLGLRETAEHTLFVEVAGATASMKVDLPVRACEVEPVQLDLTLPRSSDAAP